MTHCSLFSAKDVVIPEPLKTENPLRRKVNLSYAVSYFPHVPLLLSLLFFPLSFLFFLVSLDFSLLQKPITERPQTSPPSVPGEMFSPFIKTLRETILTFIKYLIHCNLLDYAVLHAVTQSRPASLRHPKPLPTKKVTQGNENYKDGFCYWFLQHLWKKTHFFSLFSHTSFFYLHLSFIHINVFFYSWESICQQSPQWKRIKPTVQTTQCVFCCDWDNDYPLFS